MFFLITIPLILALQSPLALAHEDIVDFDYSIARHNEPKKSSSKLYNLSKQLYEQHASALLKPEPKPIIPKIIHQIWLGSPVPEYLKTLMESWKALHPDWQYLYFYLI